ncbi:MAG: hypothetical protein HY682_04395 [Chloroflexi bacterium]|nr:hypothetical protein [Chloroflexota bacterium]
MTDGAAIRSFVEPLAGKFLFELADLDDTAWPHSQYYGIESRERTIAELCLLYAGFDPRTSSQPSLVTNRRCANWSHRCCHPNSPPVFP